MKLLHQLVLFVLLTVGALAQPCIVDVSTLNQRLIGATDTTFVVNLWATWCKPCVAELPNFEHLSRQMSGTPVKVLLVSVDARKDSSTKVGAFVLKHGITSETALLWPVDVDAIDSSWSGAIPATLIVQGARRVFYEREFTFEELKDTVDAFIKKASDKQ